MVIRVPLRNRICNRQKTQAGGRDIMLCIQYRSGTLAALFPTRDDANLAWSGLKVHLSKDNLWRQLARFLPFASMLFRNLLRPWYLVGRIQVWLHEKRHPDHPWFAPAAIAWLERHLDARMKGFEWGGGRSTLWFARRIQSLTTVECDPVWFQKVGKMVSEAGLSNIDLRLVAPDHPDALTYAADYPVLPAVAAEVEHVVDGSLDLVIVDGWYRPVCTRSALPKIKPGGLLVIDNTDWEDPPHVHVPKDWPLVHQSRNVMTETSIWRKPADGEQTNHSHS